MEKGKTHFIVIKGDGILLNQVVTGSQELLVCAKLDIIVLQHNPKQKFYYGSHENTVHSVQRQMKSVEIISGKSVSAIVLNAVSTKPAELEEIFQRTKSESNIPVYEMSISGNKKLVKYIVNISGRLNYKKVRFQRRLASIHNNFL